jgi:sporulation protein YlmC with PRC-barrel domain
MEGIDMQHLRRACLTALLFVPAAATVVLAQTAGETKLGVTVIELNDVIKGWSARRQILGHNVYNDKNEKIGEVEDIIISPERAASYAIVSSGGFLGIGSHDVAIPSQQLKGSNDRLVLPGATKETLRAMPPFEYARKKDR